MLAIALAIGLISALTGKDVIGDINTGTIIDGNGLGGIIGGSGTSTGTGSSSEAPSTTTGGDYVYKPDNTYYEEDLDMYYSYVYLENEYTDLGPMDLVVVDFYVPSSVSLYWNIEFTRSSELFDSAPGCYSIYWEEGKDGNLTFGNGFYRYLSKGASSGIFEGVGCGSFDNGVHNNGRLRFILASFDSYCVTDAQKTNLVNSVINSGFTLKVYPAEASGDVDA